MIIRKAITIDNPIPLEQLENMGINLSKPLSDDIKPGSLAKRGTKTGQWFIKRLERMLAADTQAISQNSNAFELWRTQEAALETLTKDHNKKQTALYKGAANELAVEVSALSLS